MQKEIFKNLTYDVRMTSLLKQWEILTSRKPDKNIYYSKGNDESFLKMLPFCLPIGSLSPNLAKVLKFVSCCY